jgi:D-3-phosphoglycerate dehydrogenase
VNLKEKMGDVMYRVHCLNPISKIGLQELPQTYELTDEIDGATAILVRSAVMHELELPQSVKAVARAGAGVNNIPLDVYAQKGVVVFNTPGANANAVKELTLAGMLLASRDIHGGMNWVKANREDADIAKTVEKAKAKFGGTEIKGKTIGIIGLGAIGMELAKSCVALGMKVIGTKRNLSTIDRLELPENMRLVKTKEELLDASDFISLNVPLSSDTKHLLDEEAFKKMKDGVIILNFARDALVDDEALREALDAKKVRAYVTDFPNVATANMQGVLAIPHLGASTEEAEDNCAVMAIDQMVDYIEHGNITHSVNFPDATLGKKRSHRFTLLCSSITDTTDVMKAFAGYKVHQSVMKSNQKYQTIIIEVEQKPDQALVTKLHDFPGVIHIHQC